ncbi:MAG: bacterioferritin [Clostridium sp.]|nr:bacterioferritin [Clostridium sp.]
MNNFEDIEGLVEGFLDSLPCQSDIPFPEVEVEEKNINYANMLLDAQSSAADSEIQAIAQYIYHHKTIANEHIAGALMCIALVEMRHYDVLGELITKLGGKPVLYNSNRAFWSTENIAYGDKDILCLKLDEKDPKDKEIIKQKIMLDIKGEINAINGYKFIKKNVSDKYIKKILDKIISDEEVHLQIFESIIKKYLC